MATQTLTQRVTIPSAVRETSTVTVTLASPSGATSLSVAAASGANARENDPSRCLFGFSRHHPFVQLTDETIPRCPALF